MNSLNVFVLFVGLLGLNGQAYAAMGGADTAAQALAESEMINDAAEESGEASPEINEEIYVPWEDIKTWGKYLPNILDSLEVLKREALDEEEWEDYIDFYKRAHTAALILRKGEPVYSGRATGHLYVLVQSYLDLQKSEGFQEDLGGPLGGGSYSDGRTELVLSFKKSTEKLMEFLLSSEQLVQVDGEYKLALGSNDSIVRNFSEVLISIATQLKQENIDQDFKTGLGWMITQVTNIQQMQGGDGTKRVDQETAELIDWYDLWNSSEFNVFEDLMISFHKSKKVTKDRKGKFRALGDAIDHMASAFETIKNHVGYGAGFGDRYEEDVLNEFYGE